MNVSMRVLAVILVAQGLVAGAVQAQARALDTGKSRVAFVYTVERKIAVEGRFPKFGAHVVFDERAPDKGSVRLDIDVGAIDTGSAEGDTEAKRPAWFDAPKFATASFVSTAVRRAGERRYEALGRLTIKGATREASIPFTVAPLPGGGLRAQGSLTIKRLAFGVGTGLWADTSQIADEVEVKFDLLLGPSK
ncbi:MAG TPA: YceI family protein [Burkholderiales bacterium]